MVCKAVSSSYNGETIPVYFNVDFCFWDIYESGYMIFMRHALRLQFLYIWIYVIQLVSECKNSSSYVRSYCFLLSFVKTQSTEKQIVQA